MIREEKLKDAISLALESFEDGFQIEDLWNTIHMLMLQAENWKELTSGRERKEFVLEVLETMLNEIDLPGPDWITRKAVMWFVPSLIDMFVDIAKNTPAFGD